MSRWPVAAIVACALAGGSVQAADVGANVVEALRERPRVRVIVALREPTTSVANLSLRNEEVHGVQGRVLDRLQPSDFVLTHRWASLNAFAGEVTLSGLRTLMADPEVLMVDEDPIAYMDLAETAALIRVDQVRGAGTRAGRGRGRARHGRRHPPPGYPRRPGGRAVLLHLRQRRGLLPQRTIAQSGAGAAEDDNGHGTNVTGIITSDGRVAPPGIAPDAAVAAIKVLDKTGAGTSAGILSALDFVINKHPEVKVVNLSLGLGNLFPGACDSWRCSPPPSRPPSTPCGDGGRSSSPPAGTTGPARRSRCPPASATRSRRAPSTRVTWERSPSDAGRHHRRRPGGLLLEQR